MKNFSRLSAFLWNTFVVYMAYTICRLTFSLVNHVSYQDVDFSHWLELFKAGLIFDTSAIFYTNAVFLLLLLIPIPQKETPAYYHIVRWFYVVLNGICIASNLIDSVYFQFTGKRTTMTVFAEFSNEGTSRMTKIFMQQFAFHWYLVLLFIVIIWAMWKLFRPIPKTVTSPKRPLWSYFLINLLAILLLIPLHIGGMRGGFSKAIRPITISNANQYVNQASETGIVLNTPFSLIRTFNKTPFITPHYLSESEAAALYSPLHQPTDTTAFQPMNVVVFIVESFSKQHFGIYNRNLRDGHYQGYTPYLDTLTINHGLTFHYSYANGRKSIEGMPSVLSSIPNYVEPFFLTPASLNHLSGLARCLSEEKGYTTAFFHGAENGSMGFQAFANATGFQRYYGRTEYEADPHYNGKNDYDGTWAIWDEEFMQFYCDRMSEMKAPFMTALFTATSHPPFALPDRYKGVFPKGELDVQECIGYTDHAFKEFFKKASQQPWFKNTLFVITADHTSSHIDPEYLTTLGHMSVPIIFYAPGLSTLQGYDEEKVVEQIDIMPTILGILHYDKPYVAFGKDILHTPSSETYALHWVPEMDCYEYVRGSYSVLFDGTQVTHAYRYRDDPLLKKDVHQTMPSDTLRTMERHLKSIIQQYMQRMNNDQLTVR